jgi:anti-sigma regulatory factor (Ser/Thr protein kinase)/anti-anti-sigma regulatory factor
MSLSLQSDGNRPSLAISGHVDETNVYRLVTVLDHLVEEHDRCVSLDLSELESINTTALGYLAESAGVLSERRRRLHLREASGDVRRCLHRHPLGELFCLEEQCLGHDCEIAARACLMEVFDLPSDPACCREARHRVLRVAREAGLEDQWLRDVMLALGEAVANAVRHGHSGQDDSSFTVSCLASSDRISVSVSDSGPGFRLADRPSYDETLLAESGRGIHCMNSLVDDVSFSFDGGTTVRLVKHFARA